MLYTCFHNGIILTGTSRFENGAVLINDGKIADIFNEVRLKNKVFPDHTEFIDVHGAYISPGFIDTHIHGYGGYGTDKEKKDAVRNMAALLPRVGVTSFCPTIYPNEIERMNRLITDIVDTMESEYQGSNIIGIHLEGPFISKSQLGVQRPEFAQLPDLNIMQHFYELGKQHITNMTVAPELKGMHEIALYAVSKGIVLQAGHTDARYENIIEGIQVGILHATHFFNAMSHLHHRNLNAVGSILLHPEISCEIIADGKHVHPDLITLLLKNKPLGQIVLITDALTPTEETADTLYANREEVYLENDIFLRKSDNVIAGSSLTMIKGVKNLHAYGIPVEHAVQMATHNPARVLKFYNKGTLLPGYDADITIFSKEFEILYTIIGGRTLYKSSNNLCV